MTRESAHHVDDMVMRIYVTHVQHSSSYIRTAPLEQLQLQPDQNSSP